VSRFALELRIPVSDNPVYQTVACGRLRLELDLNVTMHIPNPHIDLLAFYEIARRANLADTPELMKSSAFQRAKQLYDARAAYLREAFGKQETIDDFLELHLEGELASQGKRLEDVWAEFAPESLKRFPLAPGSL
jgi:hypothetical protein